MITLISVALLFAIGALLFFFQKVEAMKKKMQKLELDAMIGRKAKSGFLANITHEVRTPLHAILGTVQMLQNSALSVRQKKQVQDIFQAGENLLQMFDDMIDLARVDSADYSPNLSQEQFGEWLHHQCLHVKSFLNPQDIGLAVSVSPEGRYQVSADFEVLKRILFHLISNAFKFTEKGEVHLHADFSHAEVVTITLKDTGSGLLEESMGQLFQPFWQENDHSDKSQQGVGLGLAVAKKMSLMVGAKITISSQKNVGTTLRLEYPVSAVKRVVDSIPDGVRNQSVAIINNHQAEREAMAVTLAAAHCRISFNGQCPERVDQVCSNADKIFLSRSELYKNGRWNNELFEQLKDYCDKVTVLFYHHDDFSLVRQIAKKGFSRYLVRPILTNDILREDIKYDDQSVGSEKRSILLVDDEADFLILLEEAIQESMDVNVLKAKSGQEGFSILTTKNIDLIVLDIEMSGISGIEFFNRMQASGIDLPVLFLSAHYLDEEMLNNLDGKYLYRDKYAGIEEIVNSINLLLLDRRDKLVAQQPELPSVLVVDDSDVNTTLIELMLGDAGYPLSFAFNGREAIDHYQKKPTAVVLMDLQMPIVDGFEAITQIRQYEQAHQLPAAYIIALSAYSTEEEMTKARTAGCNDYCVKPIKRQVLLSMLEKVKPQG